LLFNDAAPVMLRILPTACLSPLPQRPDIKKPDGEFTKRSPLFGLKTVKIQELFNAEQLFV